METSVANSENCWEALRAEALQRSEQSQAREVEKSEDWVISSRADGKPPEGSTTRASNLKPSADELRRMYAEMTTRQIAEKLGISSSTATRWVTEAGIQRRKAGQKPSGNNLRDAGWLRGEYVDRDRSSEQIAKQLGCTPKTVTRALKDAGIEVRGTAGRKFPEVGKRHSEWLKGRFVGDKNPNWRGDQVTKYDRDRNSYKAKEWTRKVKERDGYKCVKCGAIGKLHAHHVVRWRKDASKRFDVGNGITLCVPCHQLEHKVRFPDWIG